MDDSKHKSKNCRLWIDLSGFLGKGRDYGVKAYLDNLGFIPSAVSLLSCCPDFVHEHDGHIDDTPLRWEYSCYGAWKRDFRWTRKTLKRVINALHEHGVKVFLSCMANAQQYEFETVSDWAKAHKELYLVHNTGLHGFTPAGKFATMNYYNIAARFKDGSYYEDFFASQVNRTVIDYGFDGFHAADGYKSFTLGIMAAGFSPDMLGQFETYSGISLPNYNHRAGRLTETIPPVAKWIWKNKREAWIDFWRQRQAQSWRKVSKALKAAKKEFAINSCWCTDPLESITRYGMDTTALEEAKTECVLFETDEIYTWIGPVSGPKSQRRQGYMLSANEFYATSLSAALLRGTHTPRIKHYPVIHIHDQYERFELLKSGRAHLERSMIGFQQLYRIRNRKVEPATTGVWYAVPNDVSAEDWVFLKKTEDLARSIRPADIPGPIALWSDLALENEIGPTNKQWSVHRTIYEVMAAGCPIITAAKTEEISHFKGQTLFWANPSSFSQKEQDHIWKSARKNRLIAFDSKGDFVVPSKIKALTITDAHSKAKFTVTGTSRQLERLTAWLLEEANLMKSKGLITRVRRRGNTLTVTPKQKARPFEYRGDMESHFITRVPPMRLGTAYLELIAEMARRISWPLLPGVRVQEGQRAGELIGHEGNLFYIQTKGDKLYLLAESFHHCASFLRAQWARPVAASRQLNSVMFHPKPKGKETELTTPAYGITIYEVQLD